MGKKKKRIKCTVALKSKYNKVPLETSKRCIGHDWRNTWQMRQGYTMSTKKQNKTIRHWLGGNSEAAKIWRNETGMKEGMEKKSQSKPFTIDV